MIQDHQHLAEHDVSWLAIRQPAVLRFLERELGPARARATNDAAGSRSGAHSLRGSFRDGDAFGAGLALACQILGARTQVGPHRLDHRALAAGLVSVRAGRCDRAMVRTIRDQLAALPVVLTPLEEDAIATVIAAVIWAVLDTSARALDDTLVA